MSLAAIGVAFGQPGDATGPSSSPTTVPATRPAIDRAAVEERFAKQLSGATLEGSFTTSAGAGADGRRLSADRYALGAVRKIDDSTWLFEAQMKVGGRDLTIPLRLPVEWAADTPVIVLDDFAIIGMGVFSARVLFHDGHYVGYWKHGDRGGTLFGVIRPAK